MNAATLGELADQLAIHDLISRLAQLADTGELVDYAACMTPDAEWVPPVDAGVDISPASKRGIIDITAGAQERRDAGVQGPGTHTRHVVSTVTLDRLGPDTVRGRVYWRYYGDTDATPRLLTMGHYDDEYHRGGAGWLLARRVVTRG